MVATSADAGSCGWHMPDARPGKGETLLIIGGTAAATQVAHKVV